MAEEVAPPRTSPTQPIVSKNFIIDNDFWDRIKKVEEALAEAREILNELRGGRDMERSPQGSYRTNSHGG